MGEHGWGTIEPLIARVLEHDRAAWSDFLGAAWPEWIKLIGASPSMGLRRRSEDEVREVASLVAEKLRRDDFRALRSFPRWRAERADKDFGDWMRIVTANEVRAYVRRRIAAEADAPGEGGEEPPTATRVLNEYAASPLPEELGHRPPITADQTVRQLLEFAAGRLPEERCRALALWLEGGDFGEIATVCGLRDEAEAKRSIRATVAFLRHHFTGRDEDDGVG